MVFIPVIHGIFIFWKLFKCECHEAAWKNGQILDQDMKPSIIVEMEFDKWSCP